MEPATRSNARKKLIDLTEGDADDLGKDWNISVIRDADAKDMILVHVERELRVVADDRLGRSDGKSAGRGRRRHGGWRRAWELEALRRRRRGRRRRDGVSLIRSGLTDERACQQGDSR